MNNFIGTVKNTINKAARTVKLIVFGDEDVRSAPEYGPYGMDSNPIAGLNVVYTTTSNQRQPAVLGYQNTQQIADVGESRIYSTDNSGGLKFNIWLKNDGTALFGTSDDPSAYVNHLTQYEALNSKLQDQITKINGQLALIQTAISNLGGTYAKVDIVEDFSTAKLNKLKTQ